MNNLQDVLLYQSNVIPHPALLEMRQALHEASIEKSQKRMIKSIAESREFADQILNAYQAGDLS
jgi:hypothetical protein